MRFSLILGSWSWLDKWIGCITRSPCSHWIIIVSGHWQGSSSFSVWRDWVWIQIRSAICRNLNGSQKVWKNLNSKITQRDQIAMFSWRCFQILSRWMVIKLNGSKINRTKLLWTYKSSFWCWSISEDTCWSTEWWKHGALYANSRTGYHHSHLQIRKAAMKQTKPDLNSKPSSSKTSTNSLLKRQARYWCK